MYICTRVYVSMLIYMYVCMYICVHVPQGTGVLVLAVTFSKKTSRFVSILYSLL